jgi:protocatechuate 3,4-dioxygenase beta subunit
MYGRYHGIMYFVGNNPNWDEIKKWLIFLESESIKREKYLKVYFVYGNENGYSREERKKELERIGQDLGLENTALTFVPSMNDSASEVVLNKINPSVENTFVIYRHRNIIAKQINLKPSQENFRLVSKLLDQTVSRYFSLPEPRHD